MTNNVTSNNPKIQQSKNPIIRYPDITDDVFFQHKTSCKQPLVGVRLVVIRVFRVAAFCADLFNAAIGFR